MDNPGANLCAVNIEYLYTPDRGAAQIKNVPVNISAHQRYEEGVDGDLGTSPNGPGVTDSAIVTVNSQITPSCAGIVAERPMYFNALGTNSGSDVLGVTTLGQTFYIADVAVGPQQGGGSYSSFIPILNPPSAAQGPPSSPPTIPTECRSASSKRPCLLGRAAPSFPITISLPCPRMSRSS